MVHLAHRNHKNPSRKWSRSHLKTWLSPKKTKNQIKTEKIKFQKFFQNSLRYPIDTQVYQISYKQDQNCYRQACDKFHQTDRRQTTDRRTDDRQTDRQIDDTQNKILIAVSQSQVSKTCRRKVSARSKKNNFRDCCNIYPPVLRTYNNSCLFLSTNFQKVEYGAPILRKQLLVLLMESYLRVHQGAK